jgi:threonine synthase
MQYPSTRGGIEPVSFRPAVLMGLARDGGLLLPTSDPQVADRFDRWRTLPYPELAFEILRLFADDIPEERLRAILRKSYAVFQHPDVAPVTPVGGLHILELWHGPTLAFKDVALQFLGNLFEYLLDESGDELNILAATSGDTGSAAIHGIRGRRRQRIFVLHPHGRVSAVQAMQMTSVLDDNVFNVAVDGTFDDCQSIVKAIFRDLAFRDACHLGAVNSINWARVLAQVVYYFHAAFRVMDATGAKRVRFSVPTGNFGDIFAGYVAWRMGLPVDRLVLATNENDILARFFQTGEYRLGSVAATLSPSMDIQIASNFERYLFHRAGDDAATLRSWMEAFAATGALALPPRCGGIVDPLFVAGVGNTADTLATIRGYHARHGYVLDPHTAVGVSVAERHLDPAAPMICLATAHPAKFPEAIARATGQEGLALHPAVEALKGSPQRVHRLPADAAIIAEFVRKRV